MNRASRTARFTLTLIILGLAASAQAGTVRYWRFEEGAPETVASGPLLDSSPSPSPDHGTPFGVPMYRADVPVAVIPQTGAPNTLSLELVGFEDMVEFASDFPLNEPGDKTIEFWLKWNLIHHGATLWGRPDSVPDDNRFHLHGNFDFTLGLEYRSPTGDLHVLAGSGLPENGVPFSPGKWGHVAITRQGDTYRVYINGVPQSEVTDMNPDLPNLLGWSLGGRQNQPFFGLVDEMRVSDEALTPERFLMSAPPPPAVLSVQIDILPLGCVLSRLNLVHPDSWFPIPVAILTTPTFSAKTVNPNTVRFGREGTEAPPHHHPVFIDVDRDGDRDMVLFFRTRMTGIRCGDTKAVLTGQTKDGQAFKGEDRIKTIGCSRGDDDDDDRDERNDSGRHNGWRR